MLEQAPQPAQGELVRALQTLTDDHLIHLENGLSALSTSALRAFRPAKAKPVILRLRLIKPSFQAAVCHIKVR